MNVQTLLAPDAGPPLGPSRARVLDLLHAAGSPLGVKEVGERAGLHSNTARFHLDALVEAAWRPGRRWRAHAGKARAWHTRR